MKNQKNHLSHDLIIKYTTTISSMRAISIVRWLADWFILPAITGWHVIIDPVMLKKYGWFLTENSTLNGLYTPVDPIFRYLEKNKIFLKKTRMKSLWNQNFWANVWYRLKLRFDSDILDFHLTSHLFILPNWK